MLPSGVWMPRSAPLDTATDSRDAIRGGRSWSGRDDRRSPAECGRRSCFSSVSFPVDRVVASRGVSVRRVHRAVDGRVHRAVDGRV